MTRRVSIPGLIFGLGACCLGGCLPGAVHSRDSVTVKTIKERDVASEGAAENSPSAYHVHQPSPPREDALVVEPVAQVRFPDAIVPGGAAPSVKPDEPPAPLVAPTGPEVPVVQADKAPPESPLISALRALLANQSADALDQLRSYDAATREMLMTLLPLAARVGTGDGGLDHATPQETAVLLEQLRRVEGTLRPASATANRGPTITSFRPARTITWANGCRSMSRCAISPAGRMARCTKLRWAGF
jgi:hypothetical protein